MKEIEKIVKENRKDISNYLVTLDNGDIIGVEASSEKEAEERVLDYLKEYSKNIEALELQKNKS